MFGMRCEECGEVRWSILGRSDESTGSCPICGGEMVEERRHPGRHGRLRKERRHAAVTTASTASGASSSSQWPASSTKSTSSAG